MAYFHRRTQIQVLTRDSDLKPDGYIVISEHVHITQTLIQIPIWIRIPNCNWTYFWDRYMHPDQDPSPCPEM